MKRRLTKGNAMDTVFALVMVALFLAPPTICLSVYIRRRI